MVRALVLRVATAALLVGCSERRVEEERESHRHLAEEYCKSWCTFWTACEPTLADWPVPHAVGVAPVNSTSRGSW